MAFTLKGSALNLVSSVYSSSVFETPHVDKRLRLRSHSNASNRGI
jgi:hypothetical protein